MTVRSPGDEPPSTAGTQVDLARDQRPAAGAVPTHQQRRCRERGEHERPGRVEHATQHDLGVRRRRHRQGAGRSSCVPGWIVGVPRSRRELVEQRIEAAVARLPEAAARLQPGRGVAQRPRLEPARAPLRYPAAGHEAGALKHLDVLGDRRQVIAKGRASSVTVASPARSRARIARRVGSASAAKVASSWPGSSELPSGFVTVWFSASTRRRVKGGARPRAEGPPARDDGAAGVHAGRVVRRTASRTYARPSPPGRAGAERWRR
jgi:hypothetical protein